MCIDSGIGGKRCLMVQVGGTLSAPSAIFTGQACVNDEATQGSLGLFG